MYTETKFDEIPKDVADNFKLCYISRVYKDGFDDDGNRVTNELVDRCECLDLFFTNCDMKDQWGDDWNDAPYDCNAEIPYDDHYVNNKLVSHIITKIRVSLKLNDGEGHACYYHLPEDFAYNSPFTVEMINAGMVAWLSISSDKDEIIPGCKYVIIHAGDTISSVADKLKDFETNK